ncbi:MAG: hypothetical protein II764_07920, partial [Bacteroidales bacterium]|nr:hypothetical protein [Bacteroidales bacterium]
ITVALLSLFALTLSAQNVQLKFPESLSDDVRTILTQRFSQMLSSGGMTVGEEGSVVEISLAEVSRENAPGAVAQIVLQLEVTASCGGVKEVFPLKGVGSDENDARLRAVKMLLPRSKSAQAFVECLKQSL